MPLVEIRDVTKTYRKGDQTITPLHDVEPRRRRAASSSPSWGSSGSGKSTLLNLIAGIDRPTPAASVVVNGKDITTLSPDRAGRLAGRPRRLHLPDATT